VHCSRDMTETVGRVVNNEGTIQTGETGKRRRRVV